MGMEDKMERMEYALNPLDHSPHDNEDVLLTMCENSQGSQDVVAPNNNEDIHYEVRNSDGVLQYRFVNTQENNSGNMNTQIANTPTAALQSANCQFYVISDLSSSRPCIISPKPEPPDAGCTRHLIVNSSKKRDEKRRATHNEVERRRRDKINQWIFKLKDLLPDNSDQKNKSSMGDSKGEILIKACDYIKSMQQQIESLKECLTLNEALRSENNLLAEENKKLHDEKEHLLKLLEKRETNMQNDLEHEVS